MAQAMSAGQQTWRNPMYFTACIQPFYAKGAIGVPLTYCVDAMRNGRSFLNRQVVVEQNNKIIFTLLYRFRKPKTV